MVKKSNIEIGAIGEQVVAKYLESKNCEVLERNWRVKEGEIDIIALNPSGIFSFIEVKTRRTGAFGHPLEAINSGKALRMQRLALAWLATHGCFGCAYQIDAVAVLINSNGSHAIDYRAKIL